ncbi:S49 family peptidase [Dyadobacter diqingensis]|uniref:S49 family peptidase n=1 Tax=Dyadobacter diqingensis TaxID=2938121 RepID=UPI0020C32FB3|nr:S49 family peptidase [Dyadobacter diqingensis]
MEGIILPRLAAGFDPIPSHFKSSALISPRDKDGEVSMTRVYLREYVKKGGGDVAVIPMKGTMSRNGFCGMGNEFLIDVLAEAAAEKEVKAVVVDGNTPGGTVDSIEILADAIKWFPKPIVGYVSGSVASAGVFSMSQTDYIVMEKSSAAEYGSIGVLMVHVDQSQALEKAGLNVRIFRAGESIDKATINGIEPLTPELEAEIQQDLDDAMTLFKGYVKRGRIGKLNSEDVFSGKMYNYKDAIKYGLVDLTGTLADAISIARKM